MRVVLEPPGSNGPMRAAFGALDGKLRALTAHPRCPGALRAAYEKVRGALESFVNPNGVGGGGQGGGAPPPSAPTGVAGAAAAAKAR